MATVAIVRASRSSSHGARLSTTSTCRPTTCSPRVRGEPPLDEVLRLDGPVQAVPRAATRDHLLAGRRVRAGERALVVIGAANRDPEAFPDPDRLRPGRTGPPPLAFGLGRHHCLGVSLARLEAGVLLRRLLAREPVLATPGVTWRPSPLLRGPARLTVRLGR